MIKSYIIKFIDFTRKRKIFEISMRLGCDWDGDTMTYKGTRYYVNYKDGVIKRC